MANEEVLLPENGQITVGDTDLTFDITNFGERGGERPITFVRTVGRRFRRFRGAMTDHEVSIDVTIKDTTTPDIFNTYGSIGSISVNYTGGLSYTVTWNNVYTFQFEESSDSDEYLTGTITFKCAPYDSNGSENRTYS